MPNCCWATDFINDTIQTLEDMHQSIVDITENIQSIHTCAEKINGINPEGIPEYQFTEHQVQKINQTIAALDQGMDEDPANCCFTVFKAKDCLQTTQNPVLHQLDALPATTTTTSQPCPPHSPPLSQLRLPLLPSPLLPSLSMHSTEGTTLLRSTSYLRISSTSKATSALRRQPTSPTRSCNPTSTIATRLFVKLLKDEGKHIQLLWGLLNVIDMENKVLHYLYHNPPSVENATKCCCN